MLLQSRAGGQRKPTRITFVISSYFISALHIKETIPLSQPSKCLMKKLSKGKQQGQRFIFHINCYLSCLLIYERVKLCAPQAVGLPVADICFAFSQRLILS